jgi:secreted PhoX family phosphatase
VSNSEGSNGSGGVYGLYFDRQGRPRDYKTLLSGTTWNCNGGLTPWQTWVSCEEHPGGQCYQVDPKGVKQAEKTVLGGLAGGQFEAMAVNNDNPTTPTFYVTEDKSNGAIRRFRPSVMTPGWDMLHAQGKLDYLEFRNGTTFRWTSSLTAGRQSAYNYYWNVEGIAYREGRLLFASKVQKELFIVDLKRNTWKKTSTVTGPLAGGGELDGEPDQLFLDSANVFYIAEDESAHPGLFVLHQGKYYSLLQMDASYYEEDEITGVAFSPDGEMIFFCAQHNGYLFRVRRIDGKPFEGQELLKWKVSFRV